LMKRSEWETAPPVPFLQSGALGVSTVILLSDLSSLLSISLVVYVCLVNALFLFFCLFPTSSSVGWVDSKICKSCRSWNV
jgi:hypothetical protein